jgi:hypothetical protein
MRVVDAADLVVLDAAAVLAQRLAVPADALDRDRMVDVIGDVEEVVALLRRPLEAFGRQEMPTRSANSTCSMMPR